MNILKFIEQFTDEGVIKSLHSKASRRDSFNQFGKIGAGAAVAAIPFSGLFSQKANARTTSGFTTTTTNTPTEALQLALTLEYLEDEFYQMALDTNGLVPASDQAVIALISQHENAHVEFLKSALGDAAPDKPTFDFTVGGTFDTFDNYETFLALSQAFEDTGVRAYKGQAGNLITEDGLLTAALQIHSVEARHASEIRRLRGLKGWITGNTRGAGMPDATQPVYDGEQNTNQAGYNAATEFGADAGTQAFDEPMSGDTAVSIASLFIVS